MDECMVCLETMTSWNKHSMAGCSHSICIECAARIQTIDDTSMSSDEYEVEIDAVQESDLVPRDLNPEFQSEVPLDYTVKYSQEGIKVTRVNYFILQGDNNSLQCPYCRQYEPPFYNFDYIRYYVRKRTLEWNILERKFYSGFSSFTMSKEGQTFAFKLSKDGTYLRIMWTEVNTYAFTTPKPRTHVYSDYKVMQKYRDSRTYSRSKRYMKRIR